MSSTRTSSPVASATSSSSSPVKKHKEADSSSDEKNKKNSSSSYKKNKKNSSSSYKKKPSSRGRAKEIDTSLSSAASSKPEKSHTRTRSQSKGATTAARRAAKNAPTTWKDKWGPLLAAVGSCITATLKDTRIILHIYKLNGDNDAMDRADVFYRVTNSAGVETQVKFLIFDNRFSTEYTIGVITKVYQGFKNPVNGTEIDVNVNDLKINPFPPTGVSLEEHCEGTIFLNYCNGMICHLVNAAR
jgi:hypothetical protein